MNLLPPEFIALVPSTPQEYQPRIIGYKFRRFDRTYYTAVGGARTAYKALARLYTCSDVICSSKDKWLWGHRSKGHWIVVYER